MENRSTFFDMRRLSALVLTALGALVSACPAGNAGRVRTLIPRGTGAPPPEIHADTELVQQDSRTLVLDGRHRLQATVPAGWIGVTSFVADDSGPPPVGELRVRIRLGPDPFCVIDLAVSPIVEEARVRDWIAAGRETFYFASTGTGWTATTIPMVPGVSDMGYWIPSATGHDLIRFEGRFPNERLPECKSALDAFVDSLAPIGSPHPATADGTR